MANCTFGGRRTSGGGIGLSWGLAKTLCLAAVQTESTKRCSGDWGLQNGLLGSLRTGREQLWGWFLVRDEDRVGLLCPLGPAGGEDPVQVPLVDVVGERGVAETGSSLFFQSSVVDLSHPSAAAGVSLHRDILCVFVAALGHYPGLC